MGLGARGSSRFQLGLVTVVEITTANQTRLEDSPPVLQLTRVHKASRQNPSTLGHVSDGDSIVHLKFIEAIKLVLANVLYACDVFGGAVSIVDLKVSSVCCKTVRILELVRERACFYDREERVVLVGYVLILLDDFR